MSRKTGNFEFLSQSKRLKNIKKAAETAENTCSEDAGACCALCRRAAEFAVRQYLADNKKLYDSVMFSYTQRHPYKYGDIDLVDIIRSKDFRKNTGQKTIDLLEALRVNGNKATHGYNTVFTTDEAKIGLKNLHFVLQTVGKAYFSNAQISNFDSTLIPGIDVNDTPESHRKINDSIKYYMLESFTNAASKLDKPTQSIAKEAARYIIEKGINSIEFTYIENSQCPYILKVPIDVNHSIILFAQESVCYFLYVGTNEAALSFGRDIRCADNIDTHELQFYLPTADNFDNITPLQDLPKEDLSFLDHDSHEFLFHELDDECLSALGVPTEYFSRIRDITSLQEWKKLGDKLPNGSFYALSCYLGGCPISDLIKQYQDACKNKEEGLSAAANNYLTGQAQITSADEIVNAMDSPLDRWKFYLHTYQREIAYHSYSKPILITGRAGTGKTAVAVHHIKYLTEKYDKSGKILYICFSLLLCNRITRMLQDICTEEQMSMIEVTTARAWIIRYLKSQNVNAALPVRPDLQAGEEAFKQCAEECLSALQANPAFHPYTTIVVDELQDFDDTFLRLILSLAQPKGSDNLCLFGDMYQREKTATASTNIEDLIKEICGMEIEHIQLKMNFRLNIGSTRYAANLLKTLSSSINEDIDPQLFETYSSQYDTTPQLIECSSLREECESVAKSIEDKLAAGTLPKDIAIIGRTREVLREFGQEIQKLGVSFEVADYSLNNHDGKKAIINSYTPYVIKGEDFDYVYIIDLNKDIWPSANSIRKGNDAETLNKLMDSEKILLYIAITRAKKNIEIYSSGTPSPFISILKGGKDTSRA